MGFTKISHCPIAWLRKEAGRADSRSLKKAWRIAFPAQTLVLRSRITVKFLKSGGGEICSANKQKKFKRGGKANLNSAELEWPTDKAWPLLTKRTALKPFQSVGESICIFVLDSFPSLQPESKPGSLTTVPPPTRRVNLEGFCATSDIPGEASCTAVRLKAAS